MTDVIKITKEGNAMDAVLDTENLSENLKIYLVGLLDTIKNKIIFDEILTEKDFEEKDE